jgi:hypothetical protein
MSDKVWLSGPIKIEVMDKEEGMQYKNKFVLCLNPEGSLLFQNAVGVYGTFREALAEAIKIVESGLQETCCYRIATFQDDRWIDVFRHDEFALDIKAKQKLGFFFGNHVLVHYPDDHIMYALTHDQAKHKYNLNLD